MHKTHKKINWINTLFLIGIHLAAIVGTILILALGHFHAATLVLAAALIVIVGLSVTGGYHRLFSHTTYRAVWPVRLFFLLFGAAAFEGSALEWSTDHRRHHRYTDTDKDPYNIKQGFWYAHMGWLFTLDNSTRDFSNVEDLKADRLVQWQHRFFVPLAILMSLGLPVAIASLWGDPLGGLIIAGALRIVFNLQTTFCINSVCHLWGKRTYSEEQSAVDNWVTALFTFGEGFHNFHHQFALDYRNGVRWYDIDPTKWLIASLGYFRLATDLKSVSKEQIIRYRIRSEENQLLASPNAQAESFWQPLRDQILSMSAQIHQLEKDYRAMKKLKMAEYREHLAVQRERLKQVKHELKTSLTVWTQMMRAYSKRRPSFSAS